MVSVAEFTIRTQDLPFEAALRSYPSTEIEVHRMIPTGESVLPFFWIRCDDIDAFLDVAAEESEFSDISVLERVGDGALIRTEWQSNVDLIEAFRSSACTLEAIYGSSDGWRVVVWAEDRSDFVRFQGILDEAGIRSTLVSLYDHVGVPGGARHRLTANQRETLLAAYHRGYFESPRQVSQTELGEDFGISHRAVSERLRRGTRNLIAATLVSEDDD